jgi:hypothetical protein
MTDDTETPEEAAANQLRSDFAYAIWTVILLFENEGLDRKITREVTAHIAGKDDEHWWAALAGVSRRHARQAVGRAVVDRSRREEESGP